MNYTLGRAEAIGGDLFSLDDRRVEDYPRHPTSSDERHLVVISGIVGLPGGLMASTFTTLASGVGFTISDNSRGSGIDQRQLLLFAPATNPNFGVPSCTLDNTSRRLQVGVRYAF